MVRSMDDIAVAAVPGGEYTIGSEDLPQSRPVNRVLVKGFVIGLTAVTNAQFAQFIEGGGYRNPEFWSEMGWRWQRQKQISAPAFWDDNNFNHALQPVTGVSWYEADAFARWLLLESNLPWRLPTEAEWEIAARDPKRPVWEPNPRQINSAERRLGRPWSALGMGGISWCGAYDLLGNVWEWTSSRWGRNWQTLDYAYPYDPNDGREDPSGSHARIIRGGSWFDTLDAAHPAHRGRYLPGSRGSNIGFRLARSL
ncbi:MAG: hypothetical protein OHK0046_23270 [Anaerolineae bacterium]